jgi:ferrochelatase
LVFSPAFVADCLETLIEIGDEYQEIFEEHGGEKVQLVPSSNTHPLFVKGLRALLEKELH